MTYIRRNKPYYTSEMKWCGNTNKFHINNAYKYIRKYQEIRRNSF